MASEKATLDEKLRDNRALIAEVQRLAAELALKDQALKEIKALADKWEKQPGRYGRYPEESAHYDGMEIQREICADDIQRILTRLDTQGETK